MITTNTSFVDYNLLNKLRAIPGIVERFVGSESQPMWEFSIPLGGGFAGEYTGGLWGDPVILNDELTFVFTYGDLYGDGEACMGEGTVYLEYEDEDALAYTSALENKICSRVAQVSGGFIYCCGSEQGMQGEEYLSLDVSVEKV